MPNLIVRRPARFRDALRRYKLFVDGVPVGSLRNGGHIALEVSAGVHEFVARIDWCSSPLLVIQVGDRDVEVEVGGHGRRPRGSVLGDISLNPSEYLYAREA